VRPACFHSNARASSFQNQVVWRDSDDSEHEEAAAEEAAAEEEAAADDEDEEAAADDEDEEAAAADDEDAAADEDEEAAATEDRAFVPTGASSASMPTLLPWIDHTGAGEGACTSSVGLRGEPSAGTKWVWNLSHSIVEQRATSCRSRPAWPTTTTTTIKQQQRQPQQSPSK
jgi:hypothetical protein